MARKTIDRHHLFLKGRLWWIRFTMPESLGGQRAKFPTGTSEVSQAAAIRDRIMSPIFHEGQVADIGRTLIASVKQADATGKALVALADKELNRSTPTGPTIREAAQRFVANRRDFKGRSGHTLDDYQRTLTAFEKVVSNLHLEMIEPKHVREFRDRILLVGKRWNRGAEPDLSEVAAAERLTARTVVKQIKNLITFFNWALKEELVQRNPAAAVDLPIASANRTKPPPTAAVDPLCQMPLPNAPTVGILEWETMPWFYRYTGARCGEIGQLKKRDVQTVDGLLVLDIATLKTANRSDQSESSKRRLVPVADKLKPFVDRVMHEKRDDGPDALLFPLAGHRTIRSKAGPAFTRPAWGFGNLYNRHAKAIADVHLHCWRSYAISQMAMAGIPDEIRRRVVGHSTLGVHDGYTHIDLKRLKAAVDTIA